MAFEVWKKRIGMLDCGDFVIELRVCALRGGYLAQEDEAFSTSRRTFTESNSIK